MTPVRPKKTPKPYSVPAVERTLDILEALVAGQREITITEANRKFKIPKSSLYAILQTLKSRGYVEKDQDDHYFLTLKLFSLGSALADSMDLKKQVYPLLKELTERAQLTGHVAVLDQGYAVYIEKVEVLGAIRLTTWFGKRMHVHSTAIGKALIAHLPDAEIERIVAERGLPRLTPKTITHPQELKKELAQVRSQGYSVANEENEEGVRAVAAPIFNHAGRVAAAVNLGGSTLHIKMKDVGALGELVRSYALKMSHRLGYRRVNRS